MWAVEQTNCRGFNDKKSKQNNNASCLRQGAPNRFGKDPPARPVEVPESIESDTMHVICRAAAWDSIVGATAVGRCRPASSSAAAAQQQRESESERDSDIDPARATDDGPLLLESDDAASHATNTNKTSSHQQQMTPRARSARLLYMLLR